MAENTQNRRTSRVKTAICDAFAELMYEKELSKITVRELVDKADVGRATFYKHYYDIYDVYEHIEKTVLVDLGEIITGEGIKLEYEVYPAVFEYIQENPKIFKMIFNLIRTGIFLITLITLSAALMTLNRIRHFSKTLFTGFFSNFIEDIRIF